MRELYEFLTSQLIMSADIKGIVPNLPTDNYNCCFHFICFFSGERPFNCDVCLRKFTLKHSMLRHRKKHSNAPNHISFQKPENGDVNGNGSSINNSASDLSDDESTTLAMINNKKLMEIMTQEKSEQDFMSRMVNPINKELFMKFQEKFFNMQQHLSNTNLLGNLLGISDQGVLNKMINASAEEAAKMLGVEK